MRNLFSYFFKKKPEIEIDNRPESVIIKEKLKREFPTIKFSVTRKHHYWGNYNVDITIIKSYKNLLKDDIKNVSDLLQASCNIDGTKYLTEEGNELIKKIKQIAFSIKDFSRSEYLYINVGSNEIPYVFVDLTRRVLFEKTKENENNYS